MEKRVFLAIFLSFIVLVVYQSYFAPQQPTPQTSPASTAQPSATPVSPASPAATPAAPAAPASAAAAPTTVAANARDIVVETAAVRAVFTTQGAVLKSWKLLEYKLSGEPLDLVPQDLPPSGHVLPFTITTDNDALTATLASAVYDPSASGLSR